jgi:DNA-binding response OmpR family regulator
MAYHILLTDDDELLRRSLAFSLEKAGYRVSTAASAEAALGQAQREAPDLVLLNGRSGSAAALPRSAAGAGHSGVCAPA